MVWVLFIIITLVASYGLIQDASSLPAGTDLFGILEILIWGLLPIEFALLAALIVSHRPNNTVGWLMIFPASVYIFNVFSTNYLEQFPVPPAEPTTLLWLALMLNNISWLFLIFPLLFTMLLFPDGRPPSPRWRWILFAGLGMCAFLILFGLASPTISMVENDDWAITNPLGFLPEGTDFPDGAWFAGLIIMTLSCGAAPFVCYAGACRAASTAASSARSMTPNGCYFNSLKPLAMKWNWKDKQPNWPG